MKVFLDCGTNLGQGLTEFDKKMNLISQDGWKIYCFEPNPDIQLTTLSVSYTHLTLPTTPYV